MRTAFFFSFVLLLIYSCTKDGYTDLLVSTESVKEGNIDFRNLKEGDISFYQRYEYSCASGPTDTMFKDVVLAIEVVRMNDRFYLKEYFTEGREADLNRDPIIHPISFTNGILSITEREKSKIFFFYDNDEVNFQAHNRVLLKQDDCIFNYNEEIFSGDEIGIVENISMGAINYSDKLIVSCIPVIVRADAYLVYDGAQVHMSHVNWNSEFNGDISGQRVVGFQLIN